MLDAAETRCEANFEKATDKMDLPTPSTGPSMSPNTLPSEVFDSSLNSSVNLDGRDMESPEHRGPNGSFANEDGPKGSEHAPKLVASQPVFSNEVAHMLMAIQDDMAPRVVLQASVGWTPELCRGTVFPLLCHTKHTAEVFLVDVLSDDIILDACAVLSCNPTITSLVLLGPDLSLQSLSALSSLVVTSTSLQALSLMHCLRHIAPQAMQILGEAVLYSKTLVSLNLEGNGIQDADLLPLARALAAHRTLLDINLDSNQLGYHGLDMLSEAVSVNRNLVRCPTDVYEGFFIQEQCQVNREVARLGYYTVEAHQTWPSLWRRKMRRLWYVWSKHGKTAQDDWVQVLQWLDSRGYVEQKVKQWMRLDAPPEQQPDTIWRHT
eukprot:gene4543-7034_t